MQLLSFLPYRLYFFKSPCQILKTPNRLGLGFIGHLAPRMSLGLFLHRFGVIVLHRGRNELVEPRGIRLNNPTCIRHGADWQGMTAIQTDAAFVQFTDPRWCFRATGKILDAYKRRGVNTVAKAITTWAPPSENNTTAYIAAVCGNCGVTAYQIIDLDRIRLPLVDALIMHENGQQPYKDSQIIEGFTYTGEPPPVTAAPTPKAPDPPPGWQPTGSTYAGGAGTLLGTTITGLFANYGHPLDATTAAAMTGFLALAVGYFFPGGRK
jgi:hypothetical protein